VYVRLFVEEHSKLPSPAEIVILFGSLFSIAYPILLRPEVERWTANG
jgi:hypothetical protein